MTTRTESFEVGENPRVKVVLPAGNVRLVEGEAGRIDVEAEGRDLEQIIIEKRGDTVIVGVTEGKGWWGRGTFNVDVTVPAGADLFVKLTAADLVADVDLLRLDASVTSGDVRCRDIERSATVKMASGNVRLGDVGDRLRVSGASGNVRVGSVADAEVNVASGEVDIRRVGGRLQLRTAAGDVRVRRLEGGHCECKTMSGDVQLGIPPGRTLDIDLKTLSGDVRSDLKPNPDFEGERVRTTLRVKSLSGDVLLVPADPA